MILLAWAILRLLVLWAALFAAFAGIGLGVRRALGRRAAEPDDLWMSFWLGWGSVIAFLGATCAMLTMAGGGVPSSAGGVTGIA